MASDKTPPIILQSKAGINRDGTVLDGDQYQGGQWVRFQRGRPRKMGGYRAMSASVDAPLRALFVDSRTRLNTAHLFSPYGVERLQFDITGAGGGVSSRALPGFVPDPTYTWTVSAMFDSQGGNTQMVAAATPDITDIASDNEGPIYYGDVGGSGAMTQLMTPNPLGGANIPLTTSGGVVVLQPFLFIYGSNGEIRNGQPNDLRASSFDVSVSGTRASIANVAGTKVVYGLPMRGGTASPSGLFWALDALVRVTFTGGAVGFNYDTVSSQISVLSKKGIIEYDGIFFWVGVDRFFMYNGTVREIPNDTNLNWFFENLNFTQRQKVWATKVPRFGEIWWFFPFGDAVECTHAVIFNIRENLWYDAALPRHAGFPAQVFQSPIFAGGENTVSTVFVPTDGTVGFKVGDNVTGQTSHAIGTVAKLTANSLYLRDSKGTFLSGEQVRTAGGTSAGITAPASARDVGVVWQHEVGVDKVIGQSVTAIQSYFDTHTMSFVAAPQSAVPRNVTLNKVEPDFKQQGLMTMTVTGKDYANSLDQPEQTFEFTPETEYFEPRIQRREMILRFESNVIGGDYQMGQTLATIEPGDVRP